jgi:ribosomal protein L7/L12|tara:strand:- start:4155 stop:4589 length:435 start_codon:yes stop_codon:yes gene_type:complete
LKIGEVEKRLKMLVKLCYETEPTLDDLKKIQHDTPEVTELFTQEMIEARQMYHLVRDGDYDSSSEITVAMTQANKIWKQRNHIKKVGWEEFYSIEGTIVDLLRQNQKINAIKLYRQNKLDKGEECGLKEAKEHIDALQEKLITR